MDATLYDTIFYYCKNIYFLNKIIIIKYYVLKHNIYIFSEHKYK